VAVVGPQSVVADPDANLYISAFYAHVVLRLDRSGQLTVVAGNGTFGLSGDGGLATNAALSYPAWITAVRLTDRAKFESGLKSFG
jgi:hypothetical protein